MTVTFSVYFSPEDLAWSEHYSQKSKSLFHKACCAANVPSSVVFTWEREFPGETSTENIEIIEATDDWSKHKKNVSFIEIFVEEDEDEERSPFPFIGKMFPRFKVKSSYRWNSFANIDKTLSQVIVTYKETEKRKKIKQAQLHSSLK